MKFLALIACASAITLRSAPGPDIAPNAVEHGHGPQDAADTAPALCVDKSKCNTGKGGSEVAYGPYKASNGGLTGNGHISFLITLENKKDITSKIKSHQVS